MNINDFVSQYKNYPVLFVGAGISRRYLESSYTWDELLRRIAIDLWGNDEKYLDIKARCTDAQNICSFPKVATLLEEEFNKALEQDRNGNFREINDLFYEKMRENVCLSRFKIYIAELLKSGNKKIEKEEELGELKKTRKNIGSVITTNYDSLIEELFEFNPLVGNDILLSNPYGSVYKIHGCINDISKIIITENDYKMFEEQYELIRAQMLSIFIHNPVIFIGYAIGDDNIKKVLETILSYVTLNTEEAEKVRRNFLLVEYDANSINKEVTQHDIETKKGNIRINKLKTDDYSALYRALANISLPISAMDIRKVQSVVKDIYYGSTEGGGIKVMITENLDEMRNSDKILAIGTSKTIQYQFFTANEMIQNYFNIIEDANEALIAQINKQKISSSQYFPFYGFSTVCHDIDEVDAKKKNQKINIEGYIENKCKERRNKHTSIEAIMNDHTIAESYKHQAIMNSVSNGQISLESVETYLKSLPVKEKLDTKNRCLLCLYDLKKYADR